MSDLHHYVECGLDYIYLRDIPHTEKDEATGRHIIEPDLLHHQIAKAIVLSPRGLRGPELFFLRNELGFKTREYCAMIGVSLVTLFRWEESSMPVVKHADASARLIYAASCSDGELGREVVRMLCSRASEEDDAPPANLIFGRGADGWFLVKQHKVADDLIVSE